MVHHGLFCSISEAGAVGEADAYFLETVDDIKKHGLSLICRVSSEITETIEVKHKG